jgi:predicted DNA-binding transcriptional regulator AlpA
VTLDSVDHVTSQQEYRDLSADEIASLLGVNRRTVYRIVEREDWQKKEGLRGRVSYAVPSDFIEQYVAETKVDRKTSSDMSQDGNMTRIPTQNLNAPTETVTNHILELLIKDKDSRITNLEEELQKKEVLLEDLRARLHQAEKDVVEFRTQCKGKEELIHAKDDVILAKEQAINAANAAVMLLENKKPSIELDASKQLTSGSKEEPKKGWFDKILGR